MSTGPTLLPEVEPGTPEEDDGLGAGGVALARELALLGAEAAVAAARADALDGSAWSLRRARFEALGARMRRHLAAGDVWVARLREGYGLGELDCWLVTLLLAAELHPDVAAACSLLAEDERVHLPTPTGFARLVGHALGAPIEHALAVALAGDAVRLGLVERVEVVAGRPHAANGLRFAARDLAVVLGGDPGATTGDLAVSIEPTAPTLAFDEAVGAAALLRGAGTLAVRAGSVRGAVQLALDVASALGEPAKLVAPPPDAPLDPPTLVRIRGGVLVLDLTRSPPVPGPVLDGIAARRGPTIVLLPPSASVGRRAVVDARGLDWQEAERVWSTLVPRPVAASLAARFRLNLVEARSVVAEAEHLRRAEGAADGALDEETLTERVLALGARSMGRMVSVLRSPARLDQLVVPEALRRQLDEIVAWHHTAPRARAVLGPARVGALGRGLAALFSGPPGTGKTFAAQGLANALGLNLYRIDLSQVVSKYIGDTEKALAQVFDEAEAGHGILLFDEADALFGKRSDVKDAHDRYANIEVGYLLQRMESFDGVAILTTNLRGNIDPAFLRRLKFAIEFPVPDAAARHRLWDQFLPSSDRRDDALGLDDLVTRFRLTGANIHNIAIAATHLALAEPDGRVAARHLVRATYRELEKAGLPRSDSDFGPLAHHLTPRATGRVHP